MPATIAFGAEVRGASGGPGDPQRHLPSSCPRREREEIGQVVVVVHVQVGNEDVVDLRHRDAHGEDVLDAAGAEVEEEAVAVAQFDHDARAGLIAPGRKGATADERDPHLVLPEGFTAGKVIVPAADGGRWLVVGRELQAGARPAAVGIHWHRRACLRLRRSRVSGGKTNRGRTRKCALKHVASA